MKYFIKESEKKDNKNKSISVAAASGGIGTSTIVAGEIYKKKTQKFFDIPAATEGKKRVAIIHPPKSFGAGHQSAAIALEHQLKLKGLDVYRINTEGFKQTRLKKFVTAISPAADYETLAQVRPDLYFKGMYSAGNRVLPEKSKMARKTYMAFFDSTKDIMGKITSGAPNYELGKKLKEVKPNLIISTFHSNLPEIKDFNRKAMLVGTDYELSPYFWKQKNVSEYLMPSAKSEKIFRDVGIKTPIKVTGDVPAIGKKSKIIRSPKIKKVVVMGGSLGLRTHEVGPLVGEYFKNKGVKVTILPGLNTYDDAGNVIKKTIARTELEKMKLPKHVRVWDPEKHGKAAFKSYMADADLIITRPGGATSAEIRSMGKPAITFNEAILKFNNNHEGANARVLVEGGQGKHLTLSSRIFGDPEANKKAVFNVLRDTEKDFKTMQRNAIKNSKVFKQNQKNIISHIVAEANKPTKFYNKIPKITKSTRYLGAGALVVGAAVATGLGMKVKETSKKIKEDIKQELKQVSLNILPKSIEVSPSIPTEIKDKYIKPIIKNEKST